MVRNIEIGRAYAMLKRSSTRGFTLIEVMIVVTLVVIALAIQLWLGS